LRGNEKYLRARGLLPNKTFAGPSPEFSLEVMRIHCLHKSVEYFIIIFIISTTFY
jgi:hypothetical protein